MSTIPATKPAEQGTARASSDRRMRIDQLSDAEALTSLNSTPEGLSAEEAGNRLREFGPNVIAEVPPEEINALRWRALTLPTAATVALAAAWRMPGNNNFFLLMIPLLARVYAAIGRRRALRQPAAPATP